MREQSTCPEGPEQVIGPQFGLDRTLSAVLPAAAPTQQQPATRAQQGKPQRTLPPQSQNAFSSRILISRSTDESAHPLFQTPQEPAPGNGHICLVRLCTA